MGAFLPSPVPGLPPMHIYTFTRTVTNDLLAISECLKLSRFIPSASPVPRSHSDNQPRTMTDRQGAWRKQGQRKALPPRATNSTLPVYNLGGPCVRGVKGRKDAGTKKPSAPSPQMLVTACAKQLESLNEIALEQIENGSPNGLAVEYRQLPEVRGVMLWVLLRSIGAQVFMRAAVCMSPP